MKYTDKSTKREIKTVVQKISFEVESEYGIITVSGEYKKVKNLRLRATENGIFLTIPYGKSVKLAQAFVASNSDWIRKVYSERMKRRQDAEPNAVYLFGKKRKIVISEGAEKMDIYDDEIHLNLLNGSDPNEVFIEKWTEYAKIYLTALTYSVSFSYRESLKSQGLPDVGVALVKSYWGKCFYKENKIKFNVKLLQADEECIKNVVCHELVHFTHHGHDAAFHNALQKLCPNERAEKRRLDKYALIPFPPIIKK